MKVGNVPAAWWVTNLYFKHVLYKKTFFTVKAIFKIYNINKKNVESKFFFFEELKKYFC